MEIYQIDDHGQLFIAPDIDDWTLLVDRGITAVFDLDADVDSGVPTHANQVLYIYFPFDDAELPDLHQLHALAQLGARLVTQGLRVLVHCAMGHNRSALLAGLILTYLGMPGVEAVVRLRQRRQGALYNMTFATYLETLASTTARFEWAEAVHAREDRPNTGPEPLTSLLMIGQTGC
jgi:protein-tyrosine phosphatase